MREFHYRAFLVGSSPGWISQGNAERTPARACERLLPVSGQSSHSLNEIVNRRDERLARASWSAMLKPSFECTVISSSAEKLLCLIWSHAWHNPSVYPNLIL